MYVCKPSEHVSPAFPSPFDTPMSPPRLSADTRKPYQGHTRSLVIAIDIGTTFSGVSYAFLEPAVIPKIHGVTR